VSYLVTASFLAGSSLLAAELATTVFSVFNNLERSSLSDLVKSVEVSREQADKFEQVEDELQKLEAVHVYGVDVVQPAAVPPL
jgi:hypothetical protein